MIVLVNIQFLLYRIDNYLSISQYLVIVYAVEVSKTDKIHGQSAGWIWSLYSMRVYTISISLKKMTLLLTIPQTLSISAFVAERGHLNV